MAVSTQLPDLMGWTGGPLPTKELEHIAFLLFQYRYPEATYDDRLFSEERNDCRRLALKLRGKFLQMDRWTLGNAHDQLVAGLGRLVFGDRGPTASESKILSDYAAACLSDLFSLFTGDAFMKAQASIDDADITTSANEVH